jgi:hypothetical protein
LAGDALGQSSSKYSRIAAICIFIRIQGRMRACSPASAQDSMIRRPTGSS